MGKGPFSFCRTSARRRLKKTVFPPSPTELQQNGSPTFSPLNDNTNSSNNNSLVASGVNGALAVGKGKKKTGGARLWMRFDRSGQSELVECDKNTIIRRASIPARDLRILGPVFSHSSNILGTHQLNPMIAHNFVNLEFILMLYSHYELVFVQSFCDIEHYTHITIWVFGIIAGCY